MEHAHHGHHDMDFTQSASQVPPMNHDAHVHSGNDHDGVEYTGVDHEVGGHSMNHGMMMMAMTFHFGCNEKVLFDSWKITNVGGLIGSMVGIFIMAALYEGLKYYREYLFWRSYNSIQYKSVTSPDDKGNMGASDHRIVQSDRPTMLSWPHALQTGLHVVQVVISYLLMLIFMTYNVWLCIAVLAGAATGYFLFGWKKSVVVDVTEHCH